MRAEETNMDLKFTFFFPVMAGLQCHAMKNKNHNHPMN